MLSPSRSSGGAAAGGAAASAASSSQPSLSSFLVSLLRASAPLEKALGEWHELFTVAQRVADALGNNATRWQALVGVEAARQVREEAEAAAERASASAFASAAHSAPHGAHGPAAVGSAAAADDSLYFASPLALPSASSTPAVSVIGVLASLPGLVPTLALQHQRQVDSAYKLLTSTHHDFAPAFAQLSAIFDQIHETHSLQLQHFTPYQLTRWSSTAAASAAGATASSTGSAHKKAPASAAKKGAASNAASKDKEEPGSNSVWNIMQRVETIEQMVQAEYDQHVVAWSELQATLLRASNSHLDANSSQYELRKTSATDATDHTPGVTLASANLLRAWLHMPAAEAMAAWTTRHEVPEANRPLLVEELQALKGRTSKQLTDEAVWAQDEEERE